MSNTLYITFDGPIVDNGVAQFIQQLDPTLTAQEIDSVYMMLNSPGGSVNAGITLYNYLKSLPITLTTHNIGQVDSIGNAVFLSGKTRYASPATSFLLHGVTVEFNQGARLSRANLEETLSQVKRDEKRIATIMKEHTNLSEIGLSRFFRSGKSLSPEEALKFGIISEVRDVKIPNDAKRAVFNTFPSN